MIARDPATRVTGKLLAQAICFPTTGARKAEKLDRRIGLPRGHSEAIQEINSACNTHRWTALAQFERFCDLSGRAPVGDPTDGPQPGTALRSNRAEVFDRSYRPRPIRRAKQSGCCRLKR